MRKYTQEHEWLELDGAVATVGVTQHAAEALGDLVFIELPKIGVTVAKGAGVAVVESVKAASDVYAPLAGEIVAVNDAVVTDPALVNKEPEGEGWLFKLKLRDQAEFDKLLDEAAYKAQLS